MHRECYHVYSDHHNEFIKTMKDVRSTIIDWQNHGEGHIKIFRISSDDMGLDEISVREDLLTYDEFIAN